MCGGTGGSKVAAATDEGLSPRVRGNPIMGGGGGNGSGSIPACAGEPSWRETRLTATRVYPRVCGGTCET